MGRTNKISQANHVSRGSSFLRWFLVLASVLVSLSAQAGPVDITVLHDEPERLVLRYSIGHVELTSLATNLGEYVRVQLGEESPLKHEGAPELPTVNRSVVIPDKAKMNARILSSSYRDVPSVKVLPSRGLLYRSDDPSQKPYLEGPVYREDAYYPSELLNTSEPYILRNDRGMVVRLHPVQYNPVTQSLRIYDEITVEVFKAGPGVNNVLHGGSRKSSLAFHKISKNHFLNRGMAERYAPLAEDGELLIIAHDAWLPNVQPLVDYKNSIGIAASVVGVSTIGNDAISIKAHIQNVYDSGNLAFVLLVGDVAQIASPMSWGSPSDPSYAKLAGNDDYPDIVIGRFSAETAAQVDTQVQRTIAYENPPATQQAWFSKGTGIASDEGPGDNGEMDYEHMDIIRTKLLNYGYGTVDQIHDPGAQAYSVSAAINEGRGIINYCGHGSLDSWVTTGFSNSDIDGLTNDNMLPFIISVACNNGEFQSGTCFAEAWMRATNGANPTGAIGIYASSISQSWDPPMAAQDEVIDLLVSEQYFSLGALVFAGACKMLDEYGAGGVEMFNTWHLFGDPSVRIYGTSAPPTGIRVWPRSGFSPRGDPGGPFEPNQMVYTVENYNDSPVDFSVSVSQAWLASDTNLGTLAPLSSQAVTVELGNGALALDFGSYSASIDFINVTDHDGDTSRSAVLKVGIPHREYEWNMDTDPGWSTDGQWAYGVPLGNGGADYGYADPSGGFTGENVYGYNLAGDYPADLSPQYLTTHAIDCSHLTDVSLRYRRWLGVEEAQWDQAKVEISLDGETWSQVWVNSQAVTDDDWWLETIDLSSIADGQARVFFRWGMGPTDDYFQACGWNLDDIEIWGVANCADADHDGDGDLPIPCGGGDCHNGSSAVHSGASEVCGDGLDNDCNGLVDTEEALCVRTLVVEKTGNIDSTVVSTPEGIDCGQTCQFDYEVGTVVGLWATAALGDVCYQWDGGCFPQDEQVCSVTLDQAAPPSTSISLHISPRHSLTIGMDGSGTGIVTSVPDGISCPDTCTYRWCEGSVVELSATPLEGSAFVAWSGGGCQDDETCVVELLSDEAVIANFAALHPVDITLTGLGSGSVSSTPIGVECPSVCSAGFAEGTQAVFVATPAAGSIFGGWTGAECGMDPSCTVLVSEATSLEAKFDEFLANDDSSTTDEDTPITIDVLANDRVPLGSQIEITAAGDQEHALVQDGRVVYTPPENFFGSATFNYDVIDGLGNRDTAEVTVEVAPVNDPPVLNPASLPSSPVEVTSGEELAFTLTGSDLEDDQVSFAVQDAPAGAVLDASSGDFTWTPSEDQVGQRTLSFWATDSDQADSAQHELIVNVLEPAPKPKSDDSGGCGCSAGSSNDSPLSFVLLITGLWWVFIRRAKQS